MKFYCHIIQDLLEQEYFLGACLSLVPTTSCGACGVYLASATITKCGVKTGYTVYLHLGVTNAINYHGVKTGYTVYLHLGVTNAINYHGVKTGYTVYLHLGVTNAINYHGVKAGYTVYLHLGVTNAINYHGVKPATLCISIWE